MSNENPEILSRREFLRRAGRYSAAAAAAVAGSSLLSGCDIFKRKDGSSFDRALDYTVGETGTATLDADSPDHYCGFDVDTSGAYELVLTATTSSFLPIQVTLYDDAGVQLESLPYNQYEGWIYGGTFNSMEAVRYVLHFQRNPSGDASLTYQLRVSGSYSDYSDGSYGDYSDGGYSDWDNYSDYSVWSDYYDWSNWGNWIESW